MLSHADVVEEQELKEQMVEAIINQFNAAKDVTEWMRIPYKMVERYMIVRNRNEVERKEEYAKRLVPRIVLGRFPDGE